MRWPTPSAVPHRCRTPTSARISKRDAWACRRAFIASAWCWTSCRRRGVRSRRAAGTGAAPSGPRLEGPARHARALGGRMERTHRRIRRRARLGARTRAARSPLAVARAVAGSARRTRRSAPPWRVRNECGRRRRTCPRATRRASTAASRSPHTHRADAGRHRTRVLLRWMRRRRAMDPRRTTRRLLSPAQRSRRPRRAQRRRSRVVGSRRHPRRTCARRAGRPRTRAVDRRHALRRMRLADRPRAAPANPACSTCRPTR